MAEGLTRAERIAREQRLEREIKVREKEQFFKGIQSAKEAPSAAKGIFVVIGIALISLFVIGPSSLAILEVLSQIPAWLMWAGLGIIILTFLLRKR